MNSEVDQLLENIGRKRRALRDEAYVRRDRRRHLSVASGLLAFASGASMLSVLTAYLPNTDVVKLIAALLAFMSTLVTLIAQTYFDDKEIIRMFEGAAEFHSMRERLQEILSTAKDSTDKAVQKAIGEVRKDYVAASKKYDNAIPDAGVSQTIKWASQTKAENAPSRHSNNNDAPRNPSIG